MLFFCVKVIYIIIYRGSVQLDKKGGEGFGCVFLGRMCGQNYSCRLIRLVASSDCSNDEFMQVGLNCRCF